jgi:hypothetical protein
VEEEEEGGRRVYVVVGGGRLEQLECGLAGRRELQLPVTRVTAAVVTVAARWALGQEERR